VLLGAIFDGLCAALPTLRDVESFTSERLGSRRISDTTLYELLRRIEPSPLKRNPVAKIAEK
jgi:hypothetical protein